MTLKTALSKKTDRIQVTAYVATGGDGFTPRKEETIRGAWIAMRYRGRRYLEGDKIRSGALVGWRIEKITGELFQEEASR